MNPFISIIIPVYNAEKYLHRCLDSVINQSYTDIEIIIINDGSTDNSGDICNKYAKSDSRIQVIHKKNEGVSKARNTAIDISSGDYIHCVDADDWLEKDTYQILAQEISTNKDVDIIKFNAYNAKSIIIGNIPYKGIYENDKLEEIGLKYIGSDKFGGEFIMGVPWLYLIRKSLLKENNIRFEEDLYRCEDRLFIITSILYAKRILFIDTALYHYEIVENSLSNKYDRNRWEQEKIYLSLLKKKYKQIKSDNFCSKANNRLENDTILRAIIAINNIFFSVNNNNFTENYTEVKRIVNDPFTRDSFKNFKSEKLNQKTEIIVKLIKYRQVCLLTIFNTILLYKNNQKLNG